MKFSTWIIIIVIFLILVGGIVLYFAIEKPSQDKIEQGKVYNNLSIDAFANDKQIIANYIIFYNGSVYVKGTTLANDYIMQQLEANRSYDIMVESPEVYPKIMHMNPTMLSPVRVDLVVDKIGNASMHVNGTFWQDNPLNLTIDVKGIIKNPLLCFRWSIDLIGVSINGLDKYSGTIPKRINADKCYYLNSPINNTFLMFPVNYDKFGSLRDDYIKVILIDGDVTSEDPSKIIYENSKGEDIFLKDVLYEIR